MQKYQRTVRLAAKASSNMMQYYFIPEMSTLIDEEKPITHEKLSDMTENVLEDPKLASRIKLPHEVNDIYSQRHRNCMTYFVNRLKTRTTWTGVILPLFKVAESLI